MSRLLSSLQFRLIAGFVLVLVLVLGATSWYVGYAAQREVERFQKEMEEARSARMEQMVSRYYSAGRGWPGLQPAIEQASGLYGWRIVVTDQEGNVVGDSHLRFGTMAKDPRAMGSRRFPIRSSGSEVGSVDVAASDVPGVAPEPAWSGLVADLNRYLLWAGLAAGLAGVLAVSLVSRRSLAPVRVLTAKARRLGEGDLSQRVAENGRDEVGQLGHAFNAMAENLQKAEEQRRNLVADVAHELRTPLSNIQGYLEAVKDGLLQPDSATIDTIYQQVLHLAHLVEDLRLLALAEAGALYLHLEVDSMEDVLKRAVEGVRPRAEAKGLSLSLEVPAGLPAVNMDRIRVAQVVSNLLENGIQHTDKGGSVTVTAEHTGTAMRVAVADTGEGIAPEALPHVFDRFYRADPSRARATGGAGLGLTIARQLVEAHGGRIWVESVFGKGSRFIVDIPLGRTDAGNGG